MNKIHLNTVCFITKI